MSEPYRMAVVVGSVRDGRVGPVVTHWFCGQVGRHVDAAVDRIARADAVVAATMMRQLDWWARTLASAPDPRHMMRRCSAPALPVVGRVARLHANVRRVAVGLEAEV